MHNVDIAVVGGGMVGLALAALLRDSELSVAVINRSRNARELESITEPRVSALNLASQQMLVAVGAWPLIAHQRACEYTHMHVWEKDSFANIHFANEDIQHSHLGTIVENQNIVNALHHVVSQQKNVSVFENTEIERLSISEEAAVISFNCGDLLTAKLVVGADGAESLVRKQAQLPMTFWSYDQAAIVATVETTETHGDTARQAFTPTGPLAFLPLADKSQCSIVWSQDTEQADRLMALDDEDFCEALSVAINTALGPCKLLTSRVKIPLTMRYVRQWLAPRAVVIGDAAHTIHPLAGQGVNLGFQDSIALAKALSAIEREALGQVKGLRSFERERKSEAAKMIATMEAFKQLFAGDDPIKKLIRGVGMQCFDSLTPIKRTLIQQAMGA